ncbi:hypothetical protein V2H45_06025, partial [Tumidithrix elongata RA019]|nr:hypothetical protein [Tumidithrix elongata RA019]
FSSNPFLLLFVFLEMPIKEIAHFQSWQQTLRDRCAELQGHRIVWSKDADPEKVKLLKAKRKVKRSDETL